MENLDVLEWVRQRHPNSKWVVEQVTNVTFFITKLRGHPTGRGTDLPGYLAENHGLLTLDRNHNDGRPYNDNLCFFRALALHNGCHPKTLERDAQHYYEQYTESVPEKKKFCEVNIFVYSLEPTKPDGEEGEEDNTEEDIVAQLIHRSLCHYPSTLPQPVPESLFVHQRFEEVRQVLLLFSMRNVLESRLHVKSSRANLRG